MPSSSYQPVIGYDLTATIASGQTVSSAIDLSGNTLCGFFLPSGFTGSSITLQAAASAAGPYVSVLSGGAAYSLSGSAGGYVPIESMPVTSGLRFIQLVAGIAQASSASIILAVRPL